MKQACQGKEKSRKFIETSEASFYPCSSFLYYLNGLNESNSSQDLQINAVKEEAEARKAESTYQCGYLIVFKACEESSWFHSGSS